MGCDWYGSRETLSQHNNDNVQYHLDLVTRAFHYNNNRITLLTSDITRITNERDTLTARVDDMIAKASAYKFPFNVQVGDHIDVRDGSIWYESEVLEISTGNVQGLFRVHYMGWDTRYDCMCHGSSCYIVRRKAMHLTSMCVLACYMHAHNSMGA